MPNSSVARGQGGGQSAPLTGKRNCQKLGERGGNREKEEKLGREGKKQEGSFTLPLLTDWAGYATDAKPWCQILANKIFTIHIPVQLSLSKDIKFCFIGCEFSGDFLC